MPYVGRNSAGDIDSLHRSPVLGATEYVDASAPEVQRFMNRSASGNAFDELDADVVRVLEDLVEVLIERGVLRITDLPPAAQAKLFARKDLRERHQQAARQQGFAGSQFGEIIDDTGFGLLGPAGDDTR